MKKILLIIAATAALNLTTQANVIDLTPGGFISTNPPQVYLDFLALVGINEFVIAGVSRELGWTVGGPPLEQVTPLGNPTATVNWSLTGTGYFLDYIFTVDQSNPSLINMYQVTGWDRESGERIVDVNGLNNIEGISFYGYLPGQVPDTGSTLAMLSLAGLILLTLKRQRKSGKPG